MWYYTALSPFKIIIDDIYSQEDVLKFFLRAIQALYKQKNTRNVEDINLFRLDPLEVKSILTWLPTYLEFPEIFYIFISTFFILLKSSKVKG